MINARDRDVFDLLKEQASVGSQRIRHRSSPYRYFRVQVVLVVCSTTGDGVPPTDAREWLEDLVTKNKYVACHRFEECTHD